MEFPTSLLNGTDAAIDEYNFLGSVHIKHDNWSILTGTAIIVDEIWVLTAAISVYNEPAKNIQVRCGSTYANHGGQVVNVLEVLIHPEFSIFTLDNNFAMLRLKEDLIMCKTVSLALLNSQPATLNATGVVVGFGLTLEYSTDADKNKERLRTVNTTVVDMSNANFTHVIYTKGNRGDRPSVFDWGSPLLLNGTDVFGVYRSDVSLSSEGSSSSTDSFFDLTNDNYYLFVAETVESCYYWN